MEKKRANSVILDEGIFPAYKQLMKLTGSRVHCKRRRKRAKSAPQGYENNFPNKGVAVLQYIPSRNFNLAGMVSS